MLLITQVGPLDLPSCAAPYRGRPPKRPITQVGPLDPLSCAAPKTGADHRRDLNFTCQLVAASSFRRLGARPDAWAGKTLGSACDSQSASLLTLADIDSASSFPTSVPLLLCSPPGSPKGSESCLMRVMVWVSCGLFEYPWEQPDLSLQCNLWTRADLKDALCSRHTAWRVAISCSCTRGRAC